MCVKLYGARKIVFEPQYRPFLFFPRLQLFLKKLVIFATMNVKFCFFLTWKLPGHWTKCWLVPENIRSFSRFLFSVEIFCNLRQKLKFFSLRQFQFLKILKNHFITSLKVTWKL